MGFAPGEHGTWLPSNTKVPKFAGNNTYRCSDKGVALTTEGGGGVRLLEGPDPQAWPLTLMRTSLGGGSQVGGVASILAHPCCAATTSIAVLCSRLSGCSLSVSVCAWSMQWTNKLLVLRILCHKILF